MKPITLTEEHESKLLEMCKVLFPKEQIVFSDDYYSRWCLFLMNKNLTLEIHWFEFVMIHLADKIAKKGYNAISTGVYSQLIQYNSHPIDYLYEQFKLLK